MLKPIIVRICVEKALRFLPHNENPKALDKEVILKLVMKLMKSSGEWGRFTIWIATRWRLPSNHLTENTSEFSISMQIFSIVYFLFGKFIEFKFYQHEGVE